MAQRTPLVVWLTAAAVAAIALAASAQTSGQTSGQTAGQTGGGTVAGAASSSSASSSATASSVAASPQTEPETEPPPGCQDIVIDRSLNEDLIFYNEFLREVGRAKGLTKVHALKMAIADCDTHYYYVSEDAARAVMTANKDRYLGGRSAVMVRDVETVTLASLIPPPVEDKKTKTKAGKKSAPKSGAKTPAKAPVKKP